MPPEAQARLGVAAPLLHVALAFIAGGLAAGLLAWMMGMGMGGVVEPPPSALQLTAFRQYGMSFSAKMGAAKSVDVSGQFASATIRFHALPDPPELVASTNIHRWNYSFSKIRMYQVYFVFLTFDQPLRNYKVRFIQNEGNVSGTVSDASERTLLLQFIGDPAERSVTVDILPR